MPSGRDGDGVQFHDPVADTTAIHIVVVPFLIVSLVYPEVLLYQAPPILLERASSVESPADA